jgi:hypothetical protein
VYKAQNALPTWDATLTALLGTARSPDPAPALEAAPGPAPEAAPEARQP